MPPSRANVRKMTRRDYTVEAIAREIRATIGHHGIDPVLTGFSEACFNISNTLADQGSMAASKRFASLGWQITRMIDKGDSRPI